MISKKLIEAKILCMRQHTLYTLFLSVRVSKIEYIAFSIETTSIGVIREQISVKVTTSENRMETLSNICKAIKTIIQNRIKIR
jgi:hypothetical protein